MEQLNEFLKNHTNIQHIDESFIKSTISLVNLNKINPEELLEGILDMYDYITDDDDINLFYQDMKKTDILMWKNLYELYRKQLWSIIDVPVYIDDEQTEIDDLSENDKKCYEFIKESFPSYNELIKVTPQFRRNLRFFIRNSKNQSLDIKPSAPEYIMLITDEIKNCSYIITINRTPGLLSRLVNGVDRKYLVKAFSKLGE